MPRPRSAPDLHLLSKVSTLYYLRNHTQQEIADRLHISRPKVSRLLQEALDQGIVRINITPPTGLHLELENELETAFGLEEAHIVEVDTRDRNAVQQEVGSGAAAYLARTLQPGEVIGLGWGGTLSAMVQAMSPLPTQDVRVVQALGGVGSPGSEVYAGGLVRRLAQLLGAEAVLLPAPGVVASPHARDVLREDPHVSTALKQMDAMDALFVGVSPMRSSPLLTDTHHLPVGTLAELQDAGVIAHMALRFFTADGTMVHTSLEDLILGISTEQLRRVKRVVVTAGGAEKVDALLAVLRARVAHVLITDRATAEAMLARK